MKQQFFTALALLAVVVGMASSGAAASDDGMRNATVNVTVASETAIDVHPQQITYNSLNPGEKGTATDEARNFGSLELENVGSTEIERVWVNATQTTGQAQFYGSTDPTQFNAANFLMLKPEETDGTPLQGDDQDYTFVNRRDVGAFNNSLKPSYINAPDDASYYVDTSTDSPTSASDVAVGRFRVGENEYFWAMPVGTSGKCDGTGNTFDVLLVAKKPHNATHTIPVDFTADGATQGDPDGGDTGYNTISGRDYHIYNITNNGNSNYGVTAQGNDATSEGVTLTDPSDGETRDYDVLTQCDTDDDTEVPDLTDAPVTIRTHYNVEAGGYTDLSQSIGQGGAPTTEYLMDSSSDTLEPGQAVGLDIQVNVPRGIPQGDVTQGVLRVVVSTTT